MGAACIVPHLREAYLYRPVLDHLRLLRSTVVPKPLRREQRGGEVWKVGGKSAWANGGTRGPGSQRGCGRLSTLGPTSEN